MGSGSIRGRQTFSDGVRRLHRGCESRASTQRRPDSLRAVGIATTTHCGRGMPVRKDAFASSSRAPGPGWARRPRGRKPSRLGNALGEPWRHLQIQLISDWRAPWRGLSKRRSQHLGGLNCSKGLADFRSIERGRRNVLADGARVSGLTSATPRSLRHPGMLRTVQRKASSWGAATVGLSDFIARTRNACSRPGLPVDSRLAVGGLTMGKRFAAAEEHLEPPNILSAGHICWSCWARAQTRLTPNADAEYYT